MNFRFLRRVSRIAATGAILLGSASCVQINEGLGESLIPIDQKWDVFVQEPAVLEDIQLHMSDSLSAYSTSRFTFGAVRNETFGTTIKSSSFTLIPVLDTIDFGKNTKVRQFHFSAVRDTLSTVYANELETLQNVYIYELKQPLDSTTIYSNSLVKAETLNKYVDLSKRITSGVPVYSGGDSLTFDFSTAYAEKVIRQIDAAQKASKMDSVSNFLKYLPGIYITTDAPARDGGRYNMFNLAIETNSGYVTGNYAELKITAEYDYSTEPVDTSFLFFYGPGEFIGLDENGNMTYPDQFAFNGSNHETASTYEKGIAATDKIYIEGGSGVKPVIKAEEIKSILEQQIADAGVTDPTQVVINKATIVLPYNVEGDYSRLDKYPMILSPTVRLYSEDRKYVTYAGLTDASISTENQGNINRSLNVYSPDISHHVQEILKLDRKAADYKEKIENYDIWFLIMYEEVVESDSNNNSYYDNYPYNYYYNSMMYDPYGYGYGRYGGYGGYGYGGYGYGGYGGYGYGSNYYNYAMMAYYASMYSNSSSTEETTVELDKDRYYNAVLNGPEASGEKPHIKITFSAPKSAE